MVETAFNADELETWENISRSRFIVKKFSAKGDVISEMINGRKKFHVSARERRLNQELAAADSMDPFANGMFVPIRLLESTEDAEQIASNPNLLGESEMVDLVKGNGNTLKKRIAEISNTIVLDRLLEVAHEQDVAGSKLVTISGRLDELKPVHTPNDIASR